MVKTSKAEERPSIELYMYSLNQEFPRGKGHAHFLKRMSAAKPDVSGEIVGIEQVESQVFRQKGPKVPADWSVQWLENQWIENHTKAIGLGTDDRIDPMLTAILREEDFGGILFEPQSDRVFKLNRAGVELFKQLKAHHKARKGDIASFRSEAFKDEDVTRFVAYLEGAGLWMRR